MAARLLLCCLPQGFVAGGRALGASGRNGRVALECGPGDVGKPSRCKRKQARLPAGLLGWLSAATHTHYAPAADVFLCAGVMGGATADALLKLGYPVSAWTRTPRQHRPGLRCYSGLEQLQEFASQTDVLVCLLPLTDATRWAGAGVRVRVGVGVWVR